MSTAPSRSPAESQVVLTQLMRPQQANFRGNVHGGTLLALMDEVAYACASRYSCAYCVTVAADAVEFVTPVKVGDLVTLTATVAHTGRSSMEIAILVTAVDPRHAGTDRVACRCAFTMVAIGDDGKPQGVPALRLETPADHQTNCEAILRRDLRRRYRDELDQGVCAIPDQAASPS